MDNGCGDGTSCFFVIEVRMDTTKCTNKRIAGFRKCWDLVREGERCSSKIKPRLRAEEWCTLWKEENREQSLMERHMRKFVKKRVLPHLTRKERDERYDEKTQLMTVPWNWKSNQDDRRVRRIVWSYSDNSNAQYQQIDNFFELLHCYRQDCRKAANCRY